MEQPDLLRFAAETLGRLRIPYALVGSFASSIWGESRLTQDIDVLIELKPARVAEFCAAFPQADFYVSEAAAHEAVMRHGQFNVIHPASGTKIDFMLASDIPWKVAQLARRKRVPVFPGLEIDVAAPEDVVLGKLVYYREGGSEKHLRDITGILKLSGDMIDRDYISKSALELAVGDIWQSVLEKLA